MSALAGRWNFGGSEDASADCRRMLRAQHMYGPHDSRNWSDDGIALGRNLFRLLPEDRHDRQPLIGEAGRYMLVADLRLDNRDELAAAMGFDARGMADAEVLLRAWEHWQESAFDHLLGDYAFALWDAAERQLVLARDPLGMRPLHYHQGDGFVAFASMPKGLHALGDVPYAPDDERIAEILALLPEAGPRSCFQDIARVEPGHFVVVQSAQAKTHRHWNPQRGKVHLNNDDPVEELRAHLGRAVAVRLRGAGDHVGAHLSGGLDSAAVASTAARLLGDNGRVTAFTAVPREGYDDPAPLGRIGDEGPLAAATAGLYANMDHVLVRSEPGGLGERLDRAFHLYERPLFNPCNQQWWDAINDQVRRRGLTVLLTGGMGNATITYDGMERLPELAATGRWSTLLKECRALVEAGNVRWRAAVGTAVGPWVPDAVWRSIQRLRGGYEGLASYSMVNSSRHDALHAKAGERGLDVLYRPRKQGFEARLWLLRRVDPGSFYKGILGGWGIDMRDPTCDRRLIEFCLSVPMRRYLHNGQPRALGLRALADRLPARVLAERRRGQQAIDWHESLTASRDELREELGRLRNVPAAATTLDLDRMDEAVDAWPTRDWNAPRIAATYRWALLRGAANGHFLRKASRSNA